ncbi:MAG: hypothetical protein R6U58_14530 [Bacteroidales bacterium]
MYSKSFVKSLNYKLRELELIIKQFDTGNEPSRIDTDLALARTRELYDILLQLTAAPPSGKEDEVRSEHAGKPVVPSDPQPVDNNRLFEAEGIIPDPVTRQMDDSRQERKSTVQKDTGEDTKPETDQQRTSESISESGNADRGPDKKPDREKTEAIQKDESNKEPGEKESPERDKEEKPGKKKNGTGDIERVADRFQSSKNYINRAMGDKQAKKDLTSKMQSKPISDLKNSIGLNEKFLFIKELFRGRPDRYNECLDTLNNASSYEEALDYIKTNYNWEEDNEVVEKFLSLVKRKHLPE